jgi:hypothetical protein
MRRNRALIAVLLTVTLLGATIFVLWGTSIASFMHPEVFKLLAGLVITTGIGGVASLVLSEVNAARERREADRTLVRQTLTDIVASYNDVKQIRRQLRAEAVRPEYRDSQAFVLPESYAKLLKGLSVAQLRVESHLRLIEGNRSCYPDSQQLVKRLGDAESYLGKLVAEWEKKTGGLVRQPQQNSLSEFKVLSSFVAEAKQGFKPGFAAPIEEVFSILGRAILR